MNTQYTLNTTVHKEVPILSDENRKEIYELERNKIKAESRKKIARVLKAAGVGIGIGALSGGVLAVGGAALLGASSPLIASSIPSLGMTSLLGGGMAGGAIGSVAGGVREKQRITLEQEKEDIYTKGMKEMNERIETLQAIIIQKLGEQENSSNDTKENTGNDNQSQSNEETDTQPEPEKKSIFSRFRKNAA